MNQERMRSPLGRAVGLGSAKEGAEHWWWQRLTALALVPLSLWLVVVLLSHIGSGYEQTVAWIGQPIPAILIIVLIATTFYHAALGVQVVIEDYVHREWVKLGSLIALRFACVLLAVSGIFAVLRLALKG
jgi:succinate dehydrogenase / fumarate reductase, membrane anchor subunit